MKEWQQFLTELEKELGTEIVRRWVPKVLRFDALNLYVEARDPFQANWFEEHIRPRLKKLLNQNQRPIKVHLYIAESEKTFLKKQESRNLSFAPDPLDPEMSLENFIPSEKNLIAYQLLHEPGSFNPIYLHGPPRSGKTHLLMGAAIALQKRGKRVFFAQAQTFTDHVVQAIRFGQMYDFRKVYREIDALIIDDLHIFSRKTATQEEFFHTFNALHTLGRIILLSAQTAPTQLSEIESRLISRFEWGISLSLEKTNPLLILEKKASLWKMDLQEEVKQFLLKRFLDPILALQALVLRSKGACVTALLAERLLQDLLEKEAQIALTPEKIIKTVAAHYGITSEDILGKSQTRESVFPRQIAMYFCRKELKWPFQKIGRLFAKDHSTVMTSVKQIEKAVEKNQAPEIRELLESVCK